MSQRRRYANLSAPGHTTLGIPVAGLSVPIGCINPYACGPITFDGGNTWFDPRNGQQLVQTIPPKVYYDPYGRPIGVAPPMFQQPVQQVQQPVQQVQQPVQQTDVWENKRTGERRVVPRPSSQTQTSSSPYDDIFGTPQKQVISQTPRGKQIHPSIVETGERDHWSGKEIVTFKGVKCHVPIGERNYIYSTDGSSVTIVVKQPHGGMWTMTYDI
jgi:peptidoglycan hydrolase-like protein with peptidoglycan-binding domain